jgi:hypothetical protein
LARISCYRNADEIAVADDAIGRIELDPTGTGQIDLAPGMRRAAAHMAGSIQAGAVDVAGHEAGREPERAHGLDHQDREVAAGSAIEHQGRQRILDPGFRAPVVGEALLDGVGERHQEFTGAGWASLMQELLNPTMDLVIRVKILPLHRAHEIGHLLCAVGKGVGLGIVLHLKVWCIQGQMIEADVALEPQLGCLFGEPRDSNAVAEDIVDPSQGARRRVDLDPGIQKLLIIAVAGPEHDPVLAERDRLVIVIGRYVSDREKGHLIRQPVKQLEDPEALPFRASYLRRV